MFSFTNLIIGIVMTAIGIVMVKYTYWLTNTTGPMNWIERWTGSGSTYGIYKIFGVLVAAVGLMIATGFGDNVLNFIFGPFEHFFAPFKGV